MRHLHLKPSALDRFQLPVEVSSGSVGLLQLEVCLRFRSLCISLVYSCSFSNEAPYCVPIAGAMGQAGKNVRGGANRRRAVEFEAKKFIRVLRGCSRYEDADGGGEQSLHNLKEKSLTFKPATSSYCRQSKPIS